MRARTPAAPDKLAESWNDPQLKGRVNCGEYEVDFGSVIPSVLQRANVPDLAAGIVPRRLLFCQARDARAPGAGALRLRFRQVTGAAGPNWVRYAPERPLDPTVLLHWLNGAGNP